MCPVVRVRDRIHSGWTVHGCNICALGRIRRRRQSFLVDADGFSLQCASNHDVVVKRFQTCPQHPRATRTLSAASAARQVRTFCSFAELCSTARRPRSSLCTKSCSRPPWLIRFSCTLSLVSSRFGLLDRTYIHSVTFDGSDFPSCCTPQFQPAITYLQPLF